jgi:excinuclease ABC subunit C
LQSEEDYAVYLEQVRNILKGNLSGVTAYFKNEIKKEVAALAFEKAAQLKKKLEFLEIYQAKSVVVNPKIGNADVFTLKRDKEIIYVNFMMVRNGAIIQSQTYKAETKLDETDTEVLEFCIQNMRSTFKSDAKEIIVPFSVNLSVQDVVITLPRSGDKKKLLDLSGKNAAYYIEDIKNREWLRLGQKTDTELQVLEQLKTDLQLSDLPVHIECFDNSNFQVVIRFPQWFVSKMVCPLKKITGILILKLCKG